MTENNEPNSAQPALLQNPSPADLRRVAREHNWDDGFGIPLEIACHPHCDLGLALELFWAAEADHFFDSTVEPEPHETEWAAFCRTLTRRILDGAYKNGDTVFQSPLSAVQIHKFRKQGIPEILLTGIDAALD